MNFTTIFDTVQKEFKKILSDEWPYNIHPIDTMEENFVG